MNILKRLLTTFVVLYTLTMSVLVTSVVLNSQSFDVPRSYVHLIITEHGSQGSGVLIANGVLVTAAHVYGGWDAKVFVKGKQAKLLAVDLKNDLVLLGVDLKCPCAPLAVHSPLPDTKVITVGHPLGYPLAVTEGYWVSFIEANSVALSTNSIAFGNSGGGLFTFNWFKARWELVGITHQVPGANIGFISIPVFTMTKSIPIERLIYLIHHSKQFPAEKPVDG